jgi:hypothetical protein
VGFEMKEVYRINGEKIYVEPVLIEGECPIDCVEVHPHDPERGGHFGTYKWVLNHWEEGLTLEELEAIKNTPPQPSIQEQLAEKDSEIERLQVQSELINSDLAGLMDALTEMGVL